MLLGSGVLLALSTLWVAAPSRAQPWRSPLYGPPPVPPLAGTYGDPRQTVYDNDPSAWRASEAQISQRCNLGRLMGGLIGGGVGYATSRQDGRSWAVPLGALLGSQMGCNVGAGRAPVPW